MSKNISQLTLHTGEVGLSPTQQSLKKIACLVDQQKIEARSVIWHYDPEDEHGFRDTINTFVEHCIGSKAEAGRLLLTSPMTLHRWLNNIHVPRKFVRAGLRARMIELLSDADSTSPTDKGSTQTAPQGVGALPERRFG